MIHVKKINKGDVMNEKTTQEVITYLLGEVKRLNTDLTTAMNYLEKSIDNFDSLTKEYNSSNEKYNDLTKEYNNLDKRYSAVMKEYKALYENYIALEGKMPNNRSKKYKPIDPSFVSMIGLF